MGSGASLECRTGDSLECKSSFDDDFPPPTDLPPSFSRHSSSERAATASPIWKDAKDPCSYIKGGSNPTNDDGFVVSPAVGSTVSSPKKRKKASKFPWRSMRAMSISEDEDFPAPDFLEEDLASAIRPFVAHTHLGAKEREWAVRGIYLPAESPTERLVLCLHGHGSGCTAFAWNRFWGDLVRCGFNVLAFDAPCFGRSSGARTGQANLWRADDAHLVHRLLACFGAAPGQTFALAQCMGAAMLLRALARDPAPFAHRLVLSNATLGSWPDDLDAALRRKGARLLAWHELDPDHMREAVCYRNLARLAAAPAGERLAELVDNDHERRRGNAAVLLECDEVPAPGFGRAADGHIFVFDPTPAVRKRVMAFLQGPPLLPAAQRVWEAPSETALAAGGGGGGGKRRYKFKVFVRVRPFLPREVPAVRAYTLAEGAPLVDGEEEGPAATIQYEGREPFTFARCFGEAAGAAAAAAPLARGLARVARGEGDLTVFAYGQTGAGKTHTMAELLRAAAGALLGGGAAAAVSFWQIYNDRAFDLLAGNRPCWPPGVDRAGGAARLPAPRRARVASAAALLALGAEGLSARATAATAMNDGSSRSHAVLTLAPLGGGGGRPGGKGAGRRLAMVDLAGSERVKRSGAEGDRLTEATEINGSLLALVRVLRATLDPQTAHVPYRDSLLTAALRGAFEDADHEALLYACVAPGRDNAVESYQTLRFAAAATHVEAKEKKGKNEHASDDEEEKEETREEGPLFGPEGELWVPGAPRLHCLGRDPPPGVRCRATLLLLHYYGGACLEEGAAFWSEVLASAAAGGAAAAAGVRVAALSFSGHGRSAGRPPPAGADAEGFLAAGGGVAQALRALDALGARRAVVCGFDWGGGAALQLALSHPARVRGVVAWNPSYRPPPPGPGGGGPRWVRRRALVATPSVWMPAKKVEALEAFMRKKRVRGCEDTEEGVVRLALKFCLDNGDGGDDKKKIKKKKCQAGKGR